MIPSILFTYWEGDQLSILHYFSLYSVCKYNLNFKIIIYTSKNLTSKFIEWKTGEHSVKFNECYSLDDFVKIINNQKNIIEVISIDFEQEYKINNDISCVHKADIIRIIKLYEHGGIWFDMDILFIKPIPKNLLEDESELLLFLDCETVPTGLIISSKMNKFMEQMYKFVLNNNLNLNSYQILGPHCWNHFYNNNSTNTSIKILPNEYAYPYNWITIKNFFDLNGESFIKNNTFCIHWFNGGSNTKEFINKFDKNNITNNTTCEIILKKIISEIKNQIIGTKEEYNNVYPYPHMYQDNFLDINFAQSLQKEILDLPLDSFDRYSNPFEQKYTLRDKFNFPPLLTKLFEELTSDVFVKELSEFTGYKLQLDTTRNFWGVHLYKPGDKLDIHVDAGYHPNINLKKQITLGIYLSHNWEEKFGAELEIWKGDNCSNPKAKIYEKVNTIAPIFNRLVIFTCNDYSWHGNPTECKCPDTSRRIFITLSYLSDNFSDLNKRVKAFFIARPEDSENEEKDKLRLLRADPELYKLMYRVN